MRASRVRSESTEITRGSWMSRFAKARKKFRASIDVKDVVVICRLQTKRVGSSAISIRKQAFSSDFASGSPSTGSICSARSCCSTWPSSKSRATPAQYETGALTRIWKVRRTSSESISVTSLKRFNPLSMEPRLRIVDTRFGFTCKVSSCADDIWLVARLGCRVRLPGY